MSEQLSIAVLPFKNRSSSEENEYFCDGITEEIINALAKIERLKVTSRTSSFYFKDKNISLSKIGEELNVSTILEGSVRLSGQMIRITAQLIQAKEDFHFWSESWDRKLENIFEIQDEISLLIADKLREHFGHFEIQDHLIKKQTDSISTYEYSLKGLFHYKKWNPTDIKIAISCYEKAIKLDPGHTESYVGLADCYGFMATTGFMPQVESWQKAAELTYKALELNDQLPGVHYQLANMAFFANSDYKASFKSALRAIEIKPNYVEALQFLSFLHLISGEKEESRQLLEKALIIDPLSQETMFFNAHFHYMMKDYSKALELLDNCLNQNIKNIPAHTVKCYCLLKLDRPDEVIGYFEKMPSDIIVPGEKLGLTGLAYAIKEDEVNTTKYFKELTELAAQPDGFRAQTYLFLMYATTGEFDKAFAWIDEAIETKSPLLFIHFSDPLISSLKNDPRYLTYHKTVFHKDFISLTKKKKKELLDESAVITYTKQLIDHIKEEEPHLNPNLSLRSLAEQIDIHPNQLSWLLNESLGKNFNEFINYYRVEKFKLLSKNPSNAHITLIGLAYDSGFNSKTVFNTYFKKETGMTPKQFLKGQ